MNRIRHWIVRFVIMTALLSVAWVVSAQPAELLTNPGFEGDYVEQDISGLIADGWSSWYIGDEADLPESGPAPETRVRTGDAAQSYSTFLGTHDAGVLQSVSGLTPGAPLTFSAFVYVWSTTDDMTPDVSVEPGKVMIQVGIATEGSTDPSSPTIVWSEAVERYDEFVELSITAAPLGDTATVFVRSIIADPVLQTDVYVDDASLILQAEASSVDETPTDAPVVEQPTEESATAEPATEEATTEPTEVPTPESSVDLTEFPGMIDHEVQAGENFTSIAELYGSTAEAILAANNLTPDATIFPGNRLKVPVRVAPAEVDATAVPTEEPVATAEAESAEATEQVRVTVRPGDTLSAIAERYGISVFDLARENRITNWNLVFYGQVLRIPGTGPTPTPAGPTRYTVVPGDNLVKISLRFGVPVSRIVEANELDNPNRIFYGQVLTIPND
jgi:LysM repeat protein